MSTAPPPGIVSAPLPVPRLYTLLDAATVITDESLRPALGATIEDYPQADLTVMEAFGEGSARVKSADGVFTNGEVPGYVVYLGVACDTAGVFPRESEFRRRLQAAFRAKESQAVEQILANAPVGNPQLTDTNLDKLNSGTAVGPVEGLALLENNIASVGNGMIHATPATVTAWASKYLVEPSGGVMRTKLGTLVAVGAGYIGAYPQGGSPPTGDQEWAFASGFVEIHRGEDQILGPLRESLDRSTNDVTLIAERTYAVAWIGRQSGSDSNHIQAGVLVDRSA